MTLLAGSGRQIQARVVDVVGQASTAMARAYTMDQSLPGAPTLSLVNDTGESATDLLTNAGTVRVSGLESGATWEYSTNGTFWTPGNSQSFTLIGDALYGARVRQIDVAGNVSPISTILTFTLDATAAPPVVNAVASADNVGAIEKSRGVSVTGTAEVGAAVTVSWGGINQTVTVGANGTWQASFSAAQVPADGTAALTATQTDRAGNTSALASRTITVYTPKILVTHSSTSFANSANTDTTSSAFAANGGYALFSAVNATQFGDGSASNTAFSDGATAAMNLFLFNSTTGTTQLLTHGSGAGNTTRGSTATDVAHRGLSGQYVAFTAANATLFGDGTTANTAFTDNATTATDLFVFNASTGLTQLISHAPGAGNLNRGTSNSDVAYAGIAGQYVAFTTANATLIGDGTSSNAAFNETTYNWPGSTTRDLFVFDAASGQTRLVTHLGGNTNIAPSTNLTSAQAMTYGTRNNDVAFTGISGQYLTFTTADARFIGDGTATNAGFTENTFYGTESTRDLFVYDLSTGQTKLVSHAGAGEASGVGASYTAAQAMALGSRASDLAYRGMSGQYVVFSAADAQALGDGTAANTRFSENGFYGTNTRTDLFVYDAVSGQTKLITHAGAGSPNGASSVMTATQALTTGSMAADATFASVSGQYVTFSVTNPVNLGDGTSANPTFNDLNASATDLLVFDAVSGVTKLVTHASGAGNIAQGASVAGTFAGASGRYVAFSAANATQFGDGSTSNAAFADASTTTADLFVFDAVSGLTKLVTYGSGAGNTNRGVAAAGAATFAGMTSTHIFFTAADATQFGQGGSTNAAFTDADTTKTDLFAFNISTGRTQLLSHSATSATQGGTDNAVYVGADATSAYFRVASASGYGSGWSDTTGNDLLRVVLA